MPGQSPLDPGTDDPVAQAEALLRRREAAAALGGQQVPIQSAQGNAPAGGGQIPPPPIAPAGAGGGGIMDKIGSIGPLLKGILGGGSELPAAPAVDPAEALVRAEQEKLRGRQ